MTRKRFFIGTLSAIIAGIVFPVVGLIFVLYVWTDYEDALAEEERAKEARRRVSSSPRLLG